MSAETTQSADYAESDRLALWHALNQSRAQLARAMKDAETFGHEAARLKDKARRLEQECELQRASAENGASSFQMIQEIQSDLQQRCDEQTDEILRLRAELEKSRTELRAAHEKIATAAPLRNSTVDERTLQRQAVQLERQEERLRVYAESLTAEKAEIRAIATQLTEQLRTARGANPLKDYLTVTEFEISKVELQLKKTPMASSDRPALEGCLENLVVQRDFLRSVVEASRRQLDQQAEALMSITRDEALQAVPPPPPKARLS
jgi:hypothetical protein